jgi:hypothetical protein
LPLETHSEDTIMQTPNLLEYFPNSVTKFGNEHGVRYEVTKCRCNCWFCPDCSKLKGYNLRAKLISILQSFKGLLLVTFTIDPSLFSDPESAYLYVVDNRCISVTTQDLYRWGYLHSRRYFYVLEWQEETEQVHFHVLYDASYIPWEDLLRSWSKHRPKDTGPVIGNRPAFGTAYISKPNFQGDAVYAAQYVTKYLIKMPENGFPEWVMQMGKSRRIRRYSTSRGFWNNPPKSKSSSNSKTRIIKKITYAQRIKKCGRAVNLIEIETVIVPETGELIAQRFWVGQLDVDSKTLFDRLWDPGKPERQRRSLLAVSVPHAKKIIDTVMAKEVRWIRVRKTKLAA